MVKFKKGNNHGKNWIATVSAKINADTEKVWDALVNPAAIKQYMFGTNVVSDWHEGRPIIWKGEWQGKPYEDKGEILRFTPGKIIQYSHFSPLSGLPDISENYHTVTIQLTADGNRTDILLTQDKNANEEDQHHSEQNWGMMLTALKQYLEK